VGVVVAFIVVLLVYLFYWAPAPTAGRPYVPFWGGFLLLFLLIWVAFFALRIALWRSFRPRYGGYGRGAGRMRDPAVFEARRRYARGEITREQFQQILSDLGRGPGGPPGPPPS
jgi:uncharacterized membrane protein